MKALLCISAVAMIAAAPALAQEAAKPIRRADFINKLDARFAAMDTNHDGKISRDEIVAGQARDVQRAKDALAQKMQQAFKRLDTNHDGALSLQEFMASEPNVHPTATPEQILQQLDKNHDGKLSPDEFRAADLARFNAADANHDGVVTPAEAAAAAKK